MVNVLATVNVVVPNFVTLLGLLDIAIAIFYAVSSINLLSSRPTGSATVLYIVQLVFAPLALLLVGVIMFFNGWRLDPILQFAFLLLNALVIFLGAKEFSLYRNQ
jgi:hypothetical protein